MDEGRGPPLRQVRMKTALALRYIDITGRLFMASTFGRSLMGLGVVDDADSALTSFSEKCARVIPPRWKFASFLEERCF